MSSRTKWLGRHGAYAGGFWDARAPADVMRRAHREKLALCDALEEIADRLPDDMDRAQCLTISQKLVPLLRRVHAYEQEVIFPAFESAPAHSARETVGRLVAEHVQDEAYAGDVVEVLAALGHGASVRNPEAFGFMLRALFETIRRHIAFEQAHILPVIAEAQIHRLRPEEYMMEYPQLG